MSKIFEALSKGRGELSEVLLPSLVAQQDAQAQPVPPPAAGAGSSPASDSAPQRAWDFGRLEVAEPGDMPGLLGGIRTLSLRLSSATPILPFDDGHWQASEQYRMIRTKIIQHPKQPRMLVISSAGAGDGKSVTATNLAGVLSLKTEAKVLLVDADFRRSAIYSQLGLPEQPGLAEILEGGCSLEDALIHVEQLPNLYVITAGERIANPAELLDSSRWPMLAEKFRTLFKYIIVDSPPIATVADYDLIQAVCDGVILVARPDHTNRNRCIKAAQMVPKEKLIGVVLNCVMNWFLGRAYYEDPYYYSADKKASRD